MRYPYPKENGNAESPLVFVVARVLLGAPTRDASLDDPKGRGSILAGQEHRELGASRVAPNLLVVGLDDLPAESELDGVDVSIVLGLPSRVRFVPSLLGVDQFVEPWLRAAWFGLLCRLFLGVGAKGKEANDEDGSGGVALAS